MWYLVLVLGLRTLTVAGILIFAEPVTSPTSRDCNAKIVYVMVRRNLDQNHISVPNPGADSQRLGMYV